MRWTALLLVVWLGGCAIQQPGLESVRGRSVEACGLGNLDRVRGVDAVVVIDSSASTAASSGSDVDQDGTVGGASLESRGLGDSLLAAQVASVKSLLPEIVRLDLRLSIVSFSGQERFDDPTTPKLASAVLRGKLTSHPPEIETALVRVLASGSRGTADFAAAMSRSLDALTRGSRADASRRSIVLLIADSPSPVMPGPTHYLYRAWNGDPNGPIVYSDPHMAAAAKRALRARVVFNTFGLGEAARAEQPHALSQVAGATGGRYRAVDDPAQLHCHLMAALAQ
jgi:Mg-chelatase subunit ChlD